MHVFDPAPGDGAHAEAASHAFAGAFASAQAVASRANASAVFAPPDAAPHEPTGVSEVRIALVRLPPLQYVTGEHDVPLSATDAHCVPAAQFEEFHNVSVVSQRAPAPGAPHVHGVHGGVASGGTPPR